MAENTRRFTEVSEELTEKTTTSPINNLSNNGTMFLDPQNHPITTFSSNVPPKEKSTSFEIKSVVQSSRQADEGDDSTDEYDETFSDNVDSSVISSSNNQQMNNDLDTDKFNTLTVQYQHLENGVDALSLEYSNQDSKSIDAPYIISHDHEQLGISKTDNTHFSKPLDQWQTRFKVVKIGSAEPFKRGRWSCMDFVDPPIPQEIVQESSILPEVTSASYTSEAASTLTNHTVKEVGTSPTSSTIESNILPSSCANGGTSTQSSYRAPTPQLPLESQQQTIGFSSPDNPPQTNHTVMFQQASTNTSQTVMSSTEIPVSTTNDKGYSPPLLAASSVQTSYQSTAPTNIPNGFIVPQSQNNADHEPSQNSSQNSKSSDLLKDSYPAFQALLEPLTMNIGSANEDGESAAGGTGAVALDNKIEQAMDLVKSHLMFAVREEVDVLKEKITELTDRITQLEYENGVLRAHASPEVLSQLSGTSTAPNPTVPQSPGNPPSS